MLRSIHVEKANFARQVAVKKQRALRWPRKKAGEVDQHDAPTMKQRPRMAQKKRKVQNLTSMIQTQVHSKETLQIDDDHVCMYLIVVIILPTRSKTYIRKKKSQYSNLGLILTGTPLPPRTSIIKANYTKLHTKSRLFQSLPHAE